MGTGNSGNYYHTKGVSDTTGASSTTGIWENAQPLIQKYGLSPAGYFGEKGKNCRTITTESPSETSMAFYTQLGKGGQSFPLSNGKGTMTILGDGTRIVHRFVTSTKGSPAIEISISGSTLVRDQKIHFIMEGSK